MPLYKKNVVLCTTRNELAQKREPEKNSRLSLRVFKPLPLPLPSPPARLPACPPACPSTATAVEQRAGGQAGWMRALPCPGCKDLGFKLNPAVAYEDNAAAISIATRAYLTSHTRHIHLRDLYVRELVTNGDVEIRYVKTNENIADFSAKFQPVATFRIHRGILMGICPVPSLGSPDGKSRCGSRGSQIDPAHVPHNT